MSAGAAASSSRASDDKGKFDVYVMNDGFKFTAAHFIAFKGYRERLHGHNYQVALRLRGSRGADGYVLDFLEIKEVVKKICKQMNEHFVCPMESDVMTIKTVMGEDKSENIHIICEDGAVFSMPTTDVLQLPIVHSSAEELASYVTSRVIEEFSLVKLRERNITDMEVTVAEMPNQQATYYYNLEHAYKESDEAVAPGVSEAKRQKKDPQPCLSNVLRSGEATP